MVGLAHCHNAASEVMVDWCLLYEGSEGVGREETGGGGHGGESGKDAIGETTGMTGVTGRRCREGCISVHNIKYDIMISLFQMVCENVRESRN